MSQVGRVAIGSWQYPRIFFLTGKTLTVEIAREGCWPCTLCEERVQAVDRQLRKASAPYKWTPSGVAQYVSIELPTEEQAGVGNYLSRVLGVPVRETA
ncbi:MAG: hypothetical protein UY71_C0021G0009 [Parcubacteria group bacterium GW2011_GWB1_52_7]|nr:MAG: hypothetical protein UY64_C0008G0005 [Parcubacteria group bacterium GW2011_GWA1_51_12]KKW28480.1 MAG: hypothetical protein UY71_C0021G0009 [Parcubacteria group bacterium GW2011_GWB1_52_7]